MNLLRALATVSGLTLLSRITGLVRENITASLFGASAMTDAFFVAFRLPNLLRRLFAEGAFSQAFVPMLAQARERGDEAHFRGFVDRVATLLFWSLVAVSVAGVAGAGPFGGELRIEALFTHRTPRHYGATGSGTKFFRAPAPYRSKFSSERRKYREMGPSVADAGRTPCSFALGPVEAVPMGTVNSMPAQHRGFPRRCPTGTRRRC